MATITIQTQQFTVSPQPDGTITVSPVEQPVKTIEIGVAGPPGPQGPPGPTGPPGPGSGRYVHEQQAASNDWLVTHNFGVKPVAVSVVDTAGTVVISQVVHVSDNALRILSSSPFSGTAYIGT